MALLLAGVLVFDAVISMRNHSELDSARLRRSDQAAVIRSLEDVNQATLTLANRFKAELDECRCRAAEK